MERNQSSHHEPLKTDRETYDIPNITGLGGGDGRARSGGRPFVVKGKSRPVMFADDGSGDLTGGEIHDDVEWERAECWDAKGDWVG